MKWVKASEQLPTKKGNYEIKNNSVCNNGNGQVYWDGEKWDIPKAIKGFYRVLAWQEIETNGL